MTSVDSEDDLDEAIDDAAGSIQEAYPSVDLPADSASLEDLVVLLDDPAVDDDVRRDVARVLTMLAERFPVELSTVATDLAGHLDDAAVRTYLLRALGYVSDAEPGAVAGSTEDVLSQLDTGDAAAVRAATWVLANLATADADLPAPVFPALADLLESDDEEVRRRAARAVASAPTSVLADEPEVLVRYLEMLDSPGLGRTAERALVEAAPAFGDRLTGALLDRVDAGRPGTRERAASTLARLAEAHPTLVAPAWSALLDVVRDDDDHQVRRDAAAALRAVASGTDDAELRRSLVDLVEHGDGFARRYGCLALEGLALDSAPPDFVRALAAARADEAAVVGDRAARILAEVAREHPDAVSDVAPELVEPTTDDG